MVDIDQYARNTPHEHNYYQWEKAHFVINFIQGGAK